MPSMPLAWVTVGDHAPLPVPTQALLLVLHRISSSPWHHGVGLGTTARVP